LLKILEAVAVKKFKHSNEVTDGLAGYPEIRKAFEQGRDLDQ